MKKSILLPILILAILGVTLVGFITKPKNDVKKEPESSAPAVSFDQSSETNSNAAVNFSYDIGSRYFATITKEDLNKSTSINDIIPKESNWAPYPIQKIDVKLISNNTESTRTSNNLTLTEEQIDLLKTAKYSDDLQLLASYGESMPLPNAMDQQQLNYFITVVPEKEAVYSAGKDRFLTILKEGSAVITSNVEDDQLKAGKIMFTISKKGTISDVRLTETSGYPFIDQHMMNLIENTPGSWTPAENSAGEKVDQKLVFSFGRIGC